MFIFTRYVVIEIIKYFLVTLFALTLLVTLVMGLQEGMRQGLPPQVIFRILPYMMPEMLGITIPVSLLYSVSSVYGRMNGANEVIALKSLGINPMAVVWPTLILAFLLSMLVIWLQEAAAFWQRPNLRRVVAESIEECAYSKLQKDRSFISPDNRFEVIVKRVEGDRLIQPKITIKGEKDNPGISITAAEAQFHSDLANHALNVTCIDGELTMDGGLRVTFTGANTQSIPIKPQARPDFHRDWVEMREIPGMLKQLQAVMEPLERMEAVTQATGRDMPPAPQAMLEELRRSTNRLRTETYRRLSNGFTCLCFALIGIPAAMLRRHSDVLTNFFVCFLPILAIYYPFLMVGDKMTTAGTAPPIAFWTGNVVFIVAGIMLLKRILRR